MDFIVAETSTPMEKHLKRKRKRKQKSKKTYACSYLYLANVNKIFPLMLAALATLRTNPTSALILKKCLKKLHLSLLTNTQKPISYVTETLLVSVLSLLPAILRIRSPEEVPSRGAEIVGATALVSVEMNERIASDGEIIEGLLTMLASSRRRVAMAACNAVLDLSTTSVGRQQLLEFSAVDHLMSSFLLVSTFLPKSISLFASEKSSGICPRIGPIGDDLTGLLLYAAITLVNACNMKNLATIPRELSETFLNYLKELWAIVKSQMLQNDFSECGQERYFCPTNIRTNDLAESIFRLSINVSPCTTTCTSEKVKRSIFGLSESKCENFMLNYWEVSPFVIGGLPDFSNEQESSFGSFIRSLRCEKTSNAIISSILHGLVSCPPIASDELDIPSFLKEARSGLGCPIMYGQDIRVVKTTETICGSSQEQLKQEVHFFKDVSGPSCVAGCHLTEIYDVGECKNAFQDGYTIALRGMEFRCEKIAGIAGGLAVLFGQPSVGANVYMTPPNSQGLARHCDDHCVFVCQLIGTKRWKVFSHSTVQLPRLYEPLDNLLCSQTENLASNYEEFLLREGGILYIPRGCPHEASTVIDDVGLNDTAGFSLHLTLGIEVEPPFEWEGFAHIAVHCWYRNQQNLYASGILNIMSVNLLHVAVRLIGHRDPTFRKSCLVAALSLMSDTTSKKLIDTLDLNQRSIFSYMIDKICGESRFWEAFGTVKEAMEKNEDPFHQMRWLEHLPMDGEITGHNNCVNAFMKIEELLPLCNGQKDQVEAAFLVVRSNFCHDVVFEDVVKSYKMMLEKYRNVRKQYMNGMLSLHCS